MFVCLIYERKEKTKIGEIFGISFAIQKVVVKMSMDVNTSPTNFSRNNLVAGDLALLTTSIWSEAISGRKVDTKELAKSHEQMKKEYIKAIKSTRTKEELEVLFFVASIICRESGIVLSVVAVVRVAIWRFSVLTF